MNKKSHISAIIHAIGSNLSTKLAIRVKYRNPSLTQKYFCRLMAGFRVHGHIYTIIIPALPDVQRSVYFWTLDQAVPQSTGQ